MNKLKRRFRDFQHVRYLNLCRLHNRRLGGWSRFIPLKNKWRFGRFSRILKHFNFAQRTKPRASVSKFLSLNLLLQRRKKASSKKYKISNSTGRKFNNSESTKRSSSKVYSKLTLLKHWFAKKRMRFAKRGGMRIDNGVYIPKKRLYLMKRKKVIRLTERELQIKLKKRRKKGAPHYRPPITLEKRVANFKQRSKVLLKKNPKLRKQYIFDLIRFRTKWWIEKNKWSRFARGSTSRFKKVALAAYIKLNRKLRFNKKKKDFKKKKSVDYTQKWAQTLAGTSNEPLLWYFTKYPALKRRLFAKTLGFKPIMQPEVKKRKVKPTIQAQVREWQKRYRTTVGIKQIKARNKRSRRPGYFDFHENLSLKLASYRKWKGWNNVPNRNNIENWAESLKCVRPFSYASFIQRATMFTQRSYLPFLWILIVFLFLKLRTKGEEVLNVSLIYIKFFVKICKKS